MALQSGDISIDNVTQMADVPYAAYFNCQEQISIRAQEDKRCKLKIEASVVFNKSTYMKKIIQARTLKDLKGDYELWLKCIQENLEAIKNRVSRSASRKDSRAGELDRSIEYEKAQSTTLTFSSILEEDEKQPQNWQLPRVQMRRLEIKLNVLVGLVLLLIVLEFARVL